MARFHSYQTADPDELPVRSGDHSRDRHGLSSGTIHPGNLSLTHGRLRSSRRSQTCPIGATPQEVPVVGMPGTRVLPILFQERSEDYARLSRRLSTRRTVSPRPESWGRRRSLSPPGILLAPCFILEHDPRAGPPKVVPCHRDWLLLCSTELRSGIRFQIPTPRAAKHGNRDPFLSWRQLGSSQAPKGTLRRSWHPSFWGNGPNTFFGNESQLHGVCALGAGFGSLGHGLTRGLSCA